MPSWKKIITSGSSALLLNVTASSFTGSFTGSFLGTGSYATNALSASFASTASFVNTLNQRVLITGSLTVGSSSLGPSENTITLGPRDSANEGGQIGFNAPGGTYTSASFIDNYTNLVRILRGNNATSTGLVAQWNLHTLQMQLPAYTSATAFTGTAAANLAVDSSGNVITVSTTGGTVFPYTGNAVITGSLTTTGVIYAQPNGGMYFQGGDDAALYDINISNHIGIYGVQDSTVGSIKLGSGGGIISGKSGRIGVGTTNPTVAFEVAGDAYISGNTVTNIAINNQGVNMYTLGAADASKLIEMDVSIGNTVTVPANSSVGFPIGTQIMIVQQGTGQTTIAAAGGVTLRSAGGLLNLASQYSSCTVVKRNTDDWYVFGDLA
jgi:hypothetical protein